MSARLPVQASARQPAPQDFYRLGEPEVLIRLKKVLELYVPVSRTTWWRWVKEGKAPAPVRFGLRMVAWRQREILAWQAQQRITPTKNRPNPA